VYVLPPSLDVLKTRINNDGRDPSGLRLCLGKTEIEDVKNGKYSDIIDIYITKEVGAFERAAQQLFESIKLKMNAQDDNKELSIRSDM
jgi:signal transduction histidine kinase